MAPGIFFFFFKAQELFLFSFLIGFLSLPHPQFPRFLSFQAMSYLKMFTLNETRPVYSLKPDAFEQLSASVDQYHYVPLPSVRHR